MAKPTPNHIQDKIVSLYNSGISIATIHRQINISEPTITKILRRRNIQIRKDNYQSLNIDINRINDEYNAGASTYELAIKHNCSDETIRSKIRNIRPESERNIRSYESKQKIAKSCKELWKDEEYLEKQHDGIQRWIDSGEASENAKKHYPKTLGKWIQSDESKDIISKAVKKQWENDGIREKYIKAINNQKAVAARTVGLRQYNENSSETRHNIFFQKAVDIHGDKYNYSKVCFNGSMEHVEIVCPTHGSFWQRPNHHTSLKNGCPSCPIIISSEHKEIINLLPNGINYINNDRTVLDGFEIDVYIPEYKFGVEIHGVYWHSCRDNNKKNHNKYQKLHSTKASIAQNNDITLYQFWDFEIKQRPKLIKSMISNRLGLSDRTYARKCQMIKLDRKQAMTFFNETHLHGYRSAMETYALILNNEIQCVLSLSRHSKYQWEIMRYACALNTTVVGGFSKLLKSFIKEYNPNTIMTFADRRISTGGLYTTNGFEQIEITKPNYFYNKGGIMLSRQKCQKHKLSKLLGNKYNPNETETENMLNHGYKQAFDAGHVKLLWFKN